MADAARVTNNGQVASGLLLHYSVLGPSSGLLLLRACAWPCDYFSVALEMQLLVKDVPRKMACKKVGGVGGICV